MATVARIKQGDLLLQGEVNERLPVVISGLIAHFPFDGRGGTFDGIGGNQTTQNIETGVNLIEALGIDWRNPSSWQDNHGMSWDESKQALKIVDYHNTWLKTPIVVDTNKHYQISIEVMEEVQSSTGLYLGGLSTNSIGQKVTPNYDYSYAANAQPVTGVWTTYRVTRYGTGNITSNTSTSFNTVVGWTGTTSSTGITDKLTKYYYYGGLFNYSSGGVMYIRNLSVVVTDADTSNCTISNDGISVEEGTTNLWNGLTKSSSNGDWSVITNPFLDCPFPESRVIRCTPRSYMNYYTINNSDGTKYPIGTRFTVQAWVFVEQNCDCMSSIRICGEGRTSASASYDKSKLGTWQYLKFTVTSTDVGFYFLLYANTGTGSNTWTTGNVYYANVQVEVKDIATSYTNGSRSNGELKIPMALTSDFTLSAWKRDCIDTQLHHHALTKSGATFKYYLDGVETTTYQNKILEYRGYMDAKYPSFDSGSNPFMKGFFTRRYPSFGSSWDYQSWNASLWGGYFRYYIYSDTNVTIDLTVNADNIGYYRTNMDDSTIFSIGYVSAIKTFNFVAGWNMVEVTWSDGDTGGGINGDINSTLLSHPNIKYITAEMPISFVGNNIWYNRYGNQQIKDVSVYNRALTNEEILKICKNTFSVSKTGNVNSTRLVEKPVLPSGSYYFHLHPDSKDDINKVSPSIESNTVYEDDCVWVGNDATNMWATNKTRYSWTTGTGAVTRDIPSSEMPPPFEFTGVEVAKLECTGDNFGTILWTVGGIEGPGVYYCHSIYVYLVDGDSVGIGQHWNPWNHNNKRYVPKNKWTRIDVVMPTVDNTHVSIAMEYYINKVGGGGKAYFCAPQFEKSTFASPFVNGARNDGHLEYPNSLLNISAGAISVWVNFNESARTWRGPNNNNDFKMLFSTYGASEYNKLNIRSYYTYAANTWYAHVSSSTATDSFSFTVPDGWHMVTLAWNKSTTKWKVYVDNKLISERISANLPDSYASALRIGQWDTTVWGALNMYMKNLVIMNHYPTDAEICSLYGTGLRAYKGYIQVQGKLVEGCSL